MYQGDQTPSELFFRVILFKLFNKIETWQLLDQTFGGVRYESFSVDRYDRILSDALRCGDRIYSAAYIMPPVRGKSARRKHTGHLSLIDQMMRDELPWRITEARTLQAAFEMLRSYPSIGDFLAYQYAIDLNYSALIDFSEMEFVVPGPGARRGIRKCFSDLGGLNESDLIRLVAESQAVEFNRRGLHFEDLWGRPLQLVDCQNLFCEVDKYARVAHPNVRFKGDRSRIKQAYRRRVDPIEFWYPPKWSLNDAATAAQASLSSIEPV